MIRRTQQLYLTFVVFIWGCTVIIDHNCTQCHFPACREQHSIPNPLAVFKTLLQNISPAVCLHHLKTCPMYAVYVTLSSYDILLSHHSPMLIHQRFSYKAPTQLWCFATWQQPNLHGLKEIEPHSWALNSFQHFQD